LVVSFRCFTFVKTKKMIKVTIGESKPQIKPFPKLMINNDGEVFFFVRKWIGLPITDASDGHWPYEDNDFADWSNFLDKHNFTDFNEPITIQNA
jgi:hypothetical protein